MSTKYNESLMHWHVYKTSDEQPHPRDKLKRCAATILDNFQQFYKTFQKKKTILQENQVVWNHSTEP